MSFWNSFAHQLGPRVRTLFGQHTISSAYRRVFKGNPSREDQERVLAHFASRCGWNQITAPGVASEQLWFNEGKRAAFAELFGHLSLSEQDVTALENAVRHETVINQSDAT